jgi:transposase
MGCYAPVLCRRVRSRELRELTRYRTKLVEERARLESSIQKVLEDSNVKLASVATDITGVSGRAILQALLDGQQDPQRLAELARGRLRNKRDELAQAVQGTFREHHRFLLQSQLRQLDFYDSQIGELDQEIARRLGVQAAPDDQGPDPSGGEPSGVQRPLSADHAPEGTQTPPPSSSQVSSSSARNQTEMLRILGRA